MHKQQKLQTPLEFAKYVRTYKYVVDEVMRDVDAGVVCM